MQFIKKALGNDCAEIVQQYALEVQIDSVMSSMGEFVVDLEAIAPANPDGSVPALSISILGSMIDMGLAVFLGRMNEALRLPGPQGLPPNAMTHRHPLILSDNRARDKAIIEGTLRKHFERIFGVVIRVLGKWPQEARDLVDMESMSFSRLHLGEFNDWRQGMALQMIEKFRNGILFG